ncbi:MAG: hypothetical protein HQ530_00100 [Parcubacteria group bacterium]|nr:hypothetical protein [Parcubacteria group bacterium]
MTKAEIKKLGDGPLTLRGLIVYNEKVFLPMLEKKFAGKKEFNKFRKEMLGFKKEMLGFKGEMKGFKGEMIEFKGDMLEFKAKMEDFAIEMIRFKTKTEKTQNILLTNMDTVLKKLDILLGEKKVQDFQDDKRKKMCKLMVGAAAKHKVITPGQVGQINRWEVL